jgi:hypothetical protein
MVAGIEKRNELLLVYYDCICSGLVCLGSYAVEIETTV